MAAGNKKNGQEDSSGLGEGLEMTSIGRGVVSLNTWASDIDLSVQYEVRVEHIPAIHEGRGEPKLKVEVWRRLATTPQNTCTGRR